MATIEEVKQATEQQRANVQQALAEQEAAESQLAAANSTVASQKFRRKFAGLVGLRQRQKVNESIAQSQEALVQRRQAIESYDQQVKQVEGAIQNYDKYQEDYLQAKRAMAASDPRGLTDQGKAIYTKLLEGEEASIEATVTDIEKQVGGLDPNTRAQLYDELQSNMGKVSNNQLTTNINDILGKRQSQVIEVPTVEKIEAQTVEVPMQQSNMFATPTTLKELIEQNKGQYQNPNPKPKLYGKQGEYSVFTEGSIGYQATLGIGQTLRRAVELATPEGTRRSLFFKEKVIKSEAPVLYTIASTGGNILLESLGGASLGRLMVTGASQTSAIASAEAKALKEAKAAKVEFIGKADEASLKVVARTEVGGKPIDVIQKYSYIKDTEGNIIGVRGKEISRTPISKSVDEIRLRDVAAGNKKIQGKAYNVREGILSEFTLEGPVVTKARQPISNADNTNLFFSQGFATNRQYVRVSKKKLAGLGVIDKIDETSASVLKKGQVDRGSYESNLQRSYGVYTAERVDKLPVRNKNNPLVSTMEDVKGEVYRVEGGRARLRVYKDGKVSYVYDPKVKGYVKVEQIGTETLKSDSSLLFKQQVSKNVPVAAIEEGVRASVSKQLPEILENVGVTTKTQAELTTKAVKSVSDLKSEPSQILTGTPKQALEVGETPLPVNRLFFNEDTQTATKQATVPWVRLDTRSKMLEGSKKSQANIMQVAQEFKPVEARATTTLFRALQKTKQGIKNRLTNRPVQKAVVRPARTPKLGFVFGSGGKTKDQLLPSAYDKDFEIWSFKNKKEVKLGGSSNLQSALKKARKLVDENINASFFITRAGKKVSLSGLSVPGFRPSKRKRDVLVESENIRLSLGGEKRQIKAARRKLKIW